MRRTLVQVRGVSAKLDRHTGVGHRQRTRRVVPFVAQHGDTVWLPRRVQIVRLSSAAFYPKTKVNTQKKKTVDGCERLTFLILLIVL